MEGERQGMDGGGRCKLSSARQSREVKESQGERERERERIRTQDRLDTSLLCTGKQRRETHSTTTRLELTPTYIYMYVQNLIQRGLRARLSPDGREDPTHTHKDNAYRAMEPLLEAHGHPTKQRQPPKSAENNEE